MTVDVIRPATGARESTVRLATGSTLRLTDDAGAWLLLSRASQD